MIRLTKAISEKQSHKDCFSFFKDNTYLVLGIFIAFAICMYGIIGICGFSAYPDEFGYWSVAAAILGYDWSEITGLGPYYSYGYSVILAPVLYIFHDPIITYRMAIVLNLLLQCASFPMMYFILKGLFPRERKRVLCIIASIAVLYPAWSFYVMTTMAEALLFFGVLLTIYLMLRFMKKPSVVTGIILVIVTVYLYLVHMRCLGIIGAMALTMLVWIISVSDHGKKKSRRVWLIFPLIGILFLLTFVMKDRIVAMLYHSTTGDILTWNDYSGLAYRLQKIFGLKGLAYLLKDLCGKLLYLGLATYGIGYFGICICVKKALGSLKNIRSKDTSNTDYIWIYISLLAIFQFIVALVYLNGASAVDADRLDNFLHGRYIDFFLPILIALGLIAMRTVPKPYITMGMTIVAYVILGYVAINTIESNAVHMNNPHGFTMIGMSYLLKQPLTDTTGFVIKEILLSTALTLVVDAVMLLSRSRKMEMLTATILIVQILLGLNACDHFIFPYQTYIHGDLMVGDKLKEIMETNKDKQVLHLYEGGNPYIELVQFANRDVHIAVTDEGYDKDDSYLLRDDLIVIASVDSICREDLSNYYKEIWEAGHLCLYYNP